jgi:hypothetical protein
MRISGRACVFAASVVGLIYLGCGSSSRNNFDDGTDGGGGGGGGGGAGGGNGFGDAGTGPSQDCSPASTNPAGCACVNAGATQPCYTAAAPTRNVGACHDGKQTCGGTGEILTWGACTGDVVPSTENCSGTVDLNCNGKVGCADPTCASDPVCNTGCTDGQTRPCYDGPTGTENIGTCKDGIQKCTGGKWEKTCTGEVLPVAEDCCGVLDRNCNGAKGCADLFFCITASCCQNACNSTNVDPGCVCPTGAGDTATCPAGDHGVTKAVGFPPLFECCPCTASTCSDPECCAEKVCAGNAACAGVNCKPLPPSCGGMVSADCDDFPEDCDEPCCRCAPCP